MLSDGQYGEYLIMDNNQFCGKIIIITGATGALGEKMTINLAKQKANLCLVARNDDRLDNLIEKIREYGPKVIKVQADISNEDQCKRIIDETIKEYGRIDVLINNAAISKRKEFEKYENIDSFKEYMDINYYGNVYCVRYALPYLKKTKGRIVGICSILGKIATSGNTAYCGSKHAISAFYDSLRYEIESNNVSITVIYPGYIAEKINTNNENKKGAFKRIFSLFLLNAKACADITIRAAAMRKKQVIVPSYLQLIIWINCFFPSLLGKIINIIRKVKKP